MKNSYLFYNKKYDNQLEVRYIVKAENKTAALFLLSLSMYDTDFSTTNTGWDDILPITTQPQFDARLQKHMHDIDAEYGCAVVDQDEEQRYLKAQDVMLVDSITVEPGTLPFLKGFTFVCSN